MDTSNHAAMIALAHDALTSGVGALASARSAPVHRARNADDTLRELNYLDQLQQQAAAARAGRIEADEAARRRIAHELHDSVGAELAATHFALANVHTWLPADAPPQCAEALALVARSLDAAGAALRQALDGLAAPHLDAGLVPTLADWTRSFGTRTGLATSFVCAADVRLAHLPAESALAVFRVAQEALANVARHARAAHADVRIDCTARHLTLTVSDDGIGLPNRAAKVRRADNAGKRRNQYGLAGMRERCAAFGGSLRTVSGTTGRDTVPGTAVRARFAWDALLAVSAPDSTPNLVKGARS
ncbi:sensor histidine kinase [Paraburkholderia sp. J12]|uniref:sensor histidine kinase n=1 Tax=Paraburkholderia sp. J12 TaxID=2805432 RepID=UPI002ABE6A17|nr:ATP-binding protein [Paraburkholderia sp. J12]